MTILNELEKRSSSQCELCASPDNLSAFSVSPRDSESLDECVLLCETCKEQVGGSADLDPNHWRCLGTSMWSEYPAVQVVAYRMLRRLADHDWTHPLLEQLYLDDETLAWAKSGLADESGSEPTLDSNGNQLEKGDTVTLIKDLVVKGANFTAKRGTTVKNISLMDDPKFIEAKVNGTQIVLVAAYLKKM